MTGDYSLTNINERAAKALVDLHDVAKAFEEQYVTRTALRQQAGIPVISLVGMGRAGKDTAALILSKAFALAPPQSASLVVLPFIAHMVGAPADEVYAARHSNRVFWRTACDAIRVGDLSRIARYCLATCDTVIGIRGGQEFAEVTSTGIVDLNVWIANNRVSVDSTVEFTRDDCDVVIDNHTTLDRFTERVKRFGNVVYLR